MSTTFDRVLLHRALRDAASEYALRHGEPGTADYRAAWLKFRQRIQTSEDLHRWEATLAAKRPARQRLARAGATTPDDGIHPTDPTPARLAARRARAPGPAGARPVQANP